MNAVRLISIIITTIRTLIFQTLYNFGSLNRQPDKKRNVLFRMPLFFNEIVSREALPPFLEREQDRGNYKGTIYFMHI